ncbi:short-chain dehydrogenase [Lysobacteraceae bacterium NML120232]|nr:short-chain dehydrogenase [Xanthomonadaceae bacterium NML08-0793]PJK09736.1 short-chain dehydrogenase [Xanthomonadaceae bacterium NML120232]
MANILITGANRGIGLALTRLYRNRGDNVYAVCRKTSPALDASGAHVIDAIDMSDAASIARLPQRLGDVRLDTVILNAGIFSNETLDTLDEAALAAIEKQFRVNTLGPLLTAHALLAQLAEGSKIAIITSRMGSVADNGSGGYYGYRASKAAVNAVGKSLAVDLAARGIAVCLLHPGLVATDMVGGQGDVSPEQAAEGLAGRVDELTLATSGGFWHANGSALPW